MKEFVLTKLMFLITTLITATTADDAPGIYCNSKAQTWIEAVQGCKANGGYLVSYETDVGRTVANINLNRDEDIWTADYATNDLKGDGHLELCGFVYFDRNTRFFEDIFYGECYIERYYFCWNETTSTLDVFQSTHSGINFHCARPVRIKEINRQHIKSGFYWTMDTYAINIVSENEMFPPTYRQILCGAYTAKIGKYYLNCNTTRHSLCQVSDKEGGSLDKSCFSEKLQTPAIETTSKRTIKPSVSQTDTIYRTTITYSSIEQSEYISTGNRPTTVANQTKVDMHNKDNQDKSIIAVEKHDSNLALKAGVSVGVCLALICGIILVICLLRRRNSTNRNPPGEPPNETLKDGTTLGKQNDYETLNHMYENLNTCSTNPNYTTLGDFEEKNHKYTAVGDV